MPPRQAPRAEPRDEPRAESDQTRPAGSPQAHSSPRRLPGMGIGALTGRSPQALSGQLSAAVARRRNPLLPLERLGDLIEAEHVQTLYSHLGRNEGRSHIDEDVFGPVRASTDEATD